MFPGFELITEVAGVAAGMVALVAGGSMLGGAIGIALYILRAYGLYTLAVRRGIRHPWMAWLPVTDLWLLGSISDQYRYVVHGQIRNRRKVLMGLCIAVAAGILVLCGSFTATLVKLILQIPEMLKMMPQQALSALLPSVLGMAGFGVVAWVLVVVMAVFQYVCVFDLYASCYPNNKVLFLVLSILFPVAMPVLIFVCCKKDGGMPPRKDAPVLEAEIVEE